MSRNEVHRAEGKMLLIRLMDGSGETRSAAATASDTEKHREAKCAS